MPIINPSLPADGDDAIVSPYNTAITAILGVLNGSTDADNLAAGAVTLAKLATAVQGALVPSGLIAPFGGSVAPTGWLLCDGSSQLRASYSALFAVLGTNYGSADGTHFNLPDLRGRVPVGSDTMGTSAANRMQVSTTITTVSGSPSATVGSATGLSIGMFIVAAGVTAGTTITAISGTTITMSANATANGTTVAARFSILGNDPQVLGASGGAGTHVLVIGELASHTHQQQAYSGAVINPGSTANFYGLNGSNATSGPVSQSTIAAGGDLPHTITQPSVVTSYIIKT